MQPDGTASLISAARRDAAPLGTAQPDTLVLQGPL